MKIACVSDLHGYLPNIPECDALLIGGDIVPHHDIDRSFKWLNTSFKPWVSSIAKRSRVIGIAGNHDFIFQKNPELVPDIEWTYLFDSITVVDGISIWGSPWQPIFHNWAFNLDENRLCRKWDLIPKVDILLVHGPPNGYGDYSLYGRVHTGSPGLTKKIKEIKPRFVVAGHIHEGYGLYDIDGHTTVVNASLVNDHYIPTNNIIVIDV